MPSSTARQKLAGSGSNGSWRDFSSRFPFSWAREMQENSGRPRRRIPARRSSVPDRRRPRTWSTAHPSSETSYRGCGTTEVSATTPHNLAPIGSVRSVVDGHDVELRAVRGEGQIRGRCRRHVNRFHELAILVDNDDAALRIFADVEIAVRTELDAVWIGTDPGGLVGDAETNEQSTIG